MASPEAAAGQNVEKLLIGAGWIVCDAAEANISAHCGIAIREFPLKPAFSETLQSKMFF